MIKHNNDNNNNKDYINIGEDINDSNHNSKNDD